MSEPRTWGSRLVERTAEARVLRSVLITFGGLAALLAAVGVYGLFSWAVAMRTRELAIRLALGATAGTVGGLVMRHGAVLVAVGLAGGLVAVQLLDGLLSRVLYGVSARRRRGHRRGVRGADRRGARRHGAAGVARDARQPGGRVAGGVAHGIG